MILTDYLKSERDLSWDIAAQCGIKYGVIRLPEDKNFDFTDESHYARVFKRFSDFGITPIVVEPMPNEIHEHIKRGDDRRDESIEKVIKMLPILQKFGITTICFNFMAYIGWLRTSSDVSERGGARVTGFNAKDFVPLAGASISEEKLWENYSVFINAVMPYAEKYGIKFALHPDDPPIEKLGGVSRIMTSVENIKKAIFDIYESDYLGITMCQATYYMMGADLKKTITELKDKIFFVHFRNARGVKENFRETFHDNGDLDMAYLMKLYENLGLSVPIRVDHVPSLKGESAEVAGYAPLGRLFAIGYMKGLLEGVRKIR